MRAVSGLRSLSLSIFTSAVQVNRKSYCTTPTGLSGSGKNFWKTKVFPGQGKKSGNFVDDQGNLEKTWKVREKSGKLKIMAMADSLQKIYLFCTRGEMYILMR